MIGEIIDIENFSISWGGCVSYDNGKKPSVAFYHHGEACMIVEAHEHPKRMEVFYNIGEIREKQVLWRSTFYADKLALGSDPKLVSILERNKLFISYSTNNGQALTRMEGLQQNGKRIAWSSKPAFFAAGAHAAVTAVSTQNRNTGVVTISEVENKLFSTVVLTPRV